MSKKFLHFNVCKACEAVAFLLRKSQWRSMNYMRLLKLLYIAERESLRDSGGTLAGGRVVAMRRGPVLEDIYRLIRNQHVHTPIWSTYFQVQNYHLTMVKDPGVGLLSRFAVSKLNEVWSRYENNDEFDLVEITHELEEWKKNDPGDSSKLIPLIDILSAVGREKDAEDIMEFDEFSAKSEFLPSLSESASEAACQ